MIKSIYLENWKTHKDTKLLFKEGTNTFIGKVGSGKSSIIDAMCYCLFGDFPDRAHGKITIDQTIMFKPVKKEQAKLILELEKENNLYRIEREILKKKTNVAKLYKNNKLIAGPRQKEVTQKVTEILGLDYSLFVTIVYSEQNDLDYFLKLQPQKRKEKFDELFGIFQLSKIKENANEISKDLLKDQEIQEKQKALIFNQIELYGIEQITKELEDYTNKQEKLLEEQSKIEENIKNIKEKLLLLKNKKQDYEKNKYQLQITEYKLKELKKEVEELQTNKNVFFEYQEKDLILEKQNIKELTEKIKQQFLKKQQLSLNLESYNKKREYILDQIKIKQQQEIPKDIEEKINLLEKEINFLEKQLEQKEELQKKQELETKQLINNKNFYLKQKEILENKINFLEKQLYKFDFSEKEIQEQLCLLKENQEKQQQKELLLRTNKQTINTSIKELEKGFFNCPVCDSKISEEDLKKKLEEKQQQKQEIQQQHLQILENLKNISQELLEKGLLEKKIIENKNLQKQIEEINKQQQEHLSNLKNLEELINKQKPLEDLLKEKKEIQAKKQQLELLNKQEQTYKDLKKLKKDETDLLEETKKLQEQISNIKETEEDLKDAEKKETEIVVADKYLLKKKEIDVKQKEFQQLFEKLKTIDYNEDEYIKTSTEERTIENNLINLKNNLNFLEENIKDRQKRIENYNQQKEQALKIKKKLENLRNKTKSISDFMLSLEKTKETLRTEIVSEINEALKIIWPKVYPYKDYLSARISTKKDYVLEVLTTEKEWISVEGYLSGGERACAALSIRIAVALILTKSLGLLILDEPTHNLDKEAVLTLSNLLENQLPSLVEQIFVVTHDEKLLDATNSKKFLIDRDKEIDGVSSVKEY